MQNNRPANPPVFDIRSPILVLVLSLITCGVYLVYWYYTVYDQLRAIDGRTPTNNDYWLDLLIFLVTCGIWGIYVDYRISGQLNEIYARESIQDQNDTTVLVIILDVAGYFTGYLTGVISSAIQQDQLNQLHEKLRAARPGGASAPAGGSMQPRPGSPPPASDGGTRPQNPDDRRDPYA